MSLFSRLFRRRELAADLSEELRQHLDERAERLIEQGKPAEEAYRQARRELGNLTALEEEGREVWTWPTIESVLADVRFAFRQLRREPSFAVVAILILGLGIGATTSVFSLLNAVLLRPLPFEEPERLVRIANTGDDGLSGVTSRSSNLRDWKRLSRSFEEMGAYFAFFDYGRATLSGGGEPERLVGVGVTETFLPMLGVEPMLGRGFEPEECVWNGRRAVLLTYDFWQRRYGGDPDVVGSSILLDSHETPVIGVLPPSFDFASFFSPGARIDFLNAFPVAPETDRWGNTLAVYGRLKPGATAEQAQAELDLINEQLKQEEPGRWGLGAAVSPMRDNMTGRYRDALTVLGGAVGLVLLIACANLSNLLLARGSARRKEIAVRSAMGAGRRRVLRQLLTESLLLSACGGALGVAIAFGLTRLVSATHAVTIPLLASVRVDETALGFALATALGTGILFGIAPAWHASVSREADALRDSGRSMSESKDRAWLRNGLVVFEVALACVLLVGAGLLLRSFVKILDADLGFQAEQRIAWRVETNLAFENLGERARFYGRLMERLEVIPGVEAVGLSDTLPLGRNRSWTIGAKDVDYRDGDAPEVFPRLVSAGYVEAMGIRLISGRTISERDAGDSERVVMINEAAAKALWPDRDAVGEILINQGEWRVAGVVADVRHGSLEQAGDPEVYFPITQLGDWGAADVVLRTTASEAALVPSVRQALREIDPTMATGEYRTLESIVERAGSPRRFIVTLLGAFAAAAMALAALGIYGVIAYAVNRRRAEIGIRMALGASGGSVRAGVLSDTLRLALTGVAVGLLCAAALSSLLASQLFGVSPRDPLTFASVAALLLATAACSGYVPALRASRISPMTALRAE